MGNDKNTIWERVREGQLGNECGHPPALVAKLYLATVHHAGTARSQMQFLSLPMDLVS